MWFDSRVPIGLGVCVGVCIFHCYGYIGCISYCVCIVCKVLLCMFVYSFLVSWCW